MSVLSYEKYVNKRRKDKSGEKIVISEAEMLAKLNGRADRYEKHLDEKKNGKVWTLKEDLRFGKG